MSYSELNTGNRESTEIHNWFGTLEPNSLKLIHLKLILSSQYSVKEDCTEKTGVQTISGSSITSAVQPTAMSSCAEPENFTIIPAVLNLQSHLGSEKKAKLCLSLNRF